MAPVVESLACGRRNQLSAHTSPAIHARLGTAIEPLLHVEYFHDHSRIEEQLLTGAQLLHDGMLEPDQDAPGMGICVCEDAAERYQISA